MRELFEANEVPTRVRDAYRAAVRAYVGRPGIVGVDVGWKVKRGIPDLVSGEWHVRIHVLDKVRKEVLSRRERIPSTIDGVPTDVIRAACFPQQGGAYHFEPARAERRDILQPGISMAGQGGTYGTLGMFVKEKGTQQMGILTADHVLCPAGNTSQADVVQPGPWDLHPDAESRIGKLWKRRPFMGVAVARLESTRAIEETQFGTTVVVQGTRVPRVGEVLEKSGRTTGVTRAKVLGFGGVAGCTNAVHLGPEIPGGSDVEISAAGDSGSVWYSPDDHQAIAVQCLGEPDEVPGKEWAYAALIYYAAPALNITV